MKLNLPEGVIRTQMGAYVLKQDTHLSRWIEGAGCLNIPFNIQEIIHFAHFMPSGSVAIDAGACLGDHTEIYSQLVGGDGMVYAFEPHPVTFQALKLNMARLKNVTIFECGLSDKKGDAKLNLDINIGASAVTESATGASIKIETLDEMLLPTLTRLDFIHLDAEGLEPKIIAGSTKLIEKFRPAMVLEVCDHHLKAQGSSEKEFLDMLDGMKYRIFPIPGHDHPEQRDVLAVPMTLT